MNVFHFGNADGPLFGAHHEPAPSNDLNRGVVLCAPIGLEYLRSHWCFRRLADRLAIAGMHVMRFDYTGQGDSWGGDDNASIDQWTRDVMDAIEELRDASGASKISLVGLRFGSALAYLAAARSEGIDKLILWDPVSQGAAYVGELRKLHDYRLSRWKFSRDTKVGSNGKQELIGRVWPTGLINGIESFSLSDQRPPVRDIYVLGSRDRPEYGAIGEHWPEPGVSRRIIAAAGDWDVLDEMDEALLAAPIEAAIADILSDNGS